MKTLFSLLFVCTLSIMSAQSNQVQNASNYLRTKEYDRAKAAADAASIHESTQNSAKLWMYRGQIYLAIAQSKDEAIKKLDTEAEEKALQSLINCIKFDKDNIYKGQIKNDFVGAGVALYNKALAYTDKKEHDKALSALDLVESALPYDTDKLLKSSNITADRITYIRFNIYTNAGDKAKSKEYADKLINLKYNDITIYMDMIKLSLTEKDTTAALAYIDKGKLAYPENPDFTNQEINIYLAQNKTDILKNKLFEAIKLSPTNPILHSILANLYEKTKDVENAEKSYLKALEIKPDFEVANYNLGVLYFNYGNQWNQKINDLPLSENKKAKEYETKANEYFNKATVYLEKAYEVNPDKATKQRLKQLFTRLGNLEKAAKYK